MAETLEEKLATLDIFGDAFLYWIGKAFYPDKKYKKHLSRSEMDLYNLLVDRFNRMSDQLLDNYGHITRDKLHKKFSAPVADETLDLFFQSRDYLSGNRFAHISSETLVQGISPAGSEVGLDGYQYEPGNSELNTCNAIMQLLYYHRNLGAFNDSGNFLQKYIDQKTRVLCFVPSIHLSPFGFTVHIGGAAVGIFAFGAAANYTSSLVGIDQGHLHDTISFIGHITGLYAGLAVGDYLIRKHNSS